MSPSSSVFPLPPLRPPPPSSALALDNTLCPLLPLLLLLLLGQPLHFPSFPSFLSFPRNTSSELYAVSRVQGFRTDDSLKPRPKLRRRSPHLHQARIP